MYGLQLNSSEKFQNFSDEFNTHVLAFKENNFISLDVFRNLYRKDKILFHKIVSEAILKGHIFKLEKSSVLFPEIKVKNDEYIYINKANLKNQDFKKIDFSKIGIANEIAQFNITDNSFFQAIPLDGFDVFNISNFNKKFLYRELKKVNFDVISLSQLKQNLTVNNLTTSKIKIHKFVKINNHLNTFSSDNLIKKDNSSFTNTNDINTEKTFQLTSNEDKSVNNVNKIFQIRELRKIINHCLLNNVSIKKAINDEALVKKLNDNNVYLFRNFYKKEDVFKNYSQSECKTITDAARKLAQNKELLENNFYKYIKQHRFNTSKIQDFYFSNKVESIVVKLIRNNINYINNFNKKVIYQLFNDVDIKTIVYFIDEIKKETCYQDDYIINPKISQDTKQLIVNKINDSLEANHFITFKQLFNEFKFDRELVIDFINQQGITTLEYFIKIIKKFFPNYINYEIDYLYDVRFFDDLNKMQIILKKYGDEYHRVTKNIILSSLTNDFNYCSNKTEELISALENNDIMKLDDEFYINPQDMPLISQDDINRINNILLERLNNNCYLLLKPIRISRKLSRLDYPYSWSPQLIEYIATHLLNWKKVDSSLYKQETTIIALNNSKVSYETILQSEFINFEGEKYEKVVYEQFNKLGLINNRGDNKTIPSQIKKNLFRQDELGYLSLR